MGFPKGYLDLPDMTEDHKCELAGDTWCVTSASRLMLSIPENGKPLWPPLELVEDTGMTTDENIIGVPVTCAETVGEPTWIPEENESLLPVLVEQTPMTSRQIGVVRQVSMGFE